MPARTLKRVRLAGESLGAMTWHPGQQVRVQVGEPGSAELRLRTYSIFDYQAEEGWLDLVVMLHGNGPGSAWAAAAQEGDAACLYGPLGSFVLNQRARHHVFVGDETGVVAMQAMLRHLPPGHSAVALFEGDQRADALPAVSPGEHWVFREGQPAGAGSAMCRALGEWIPGPAGPEVPPRCVYLAGEMGATLEMRDFLLTQRGLRRIDIRVKTFWAHGKEGLT